MARNDNSDLPIGMIGEAPATIAEYRRLVAKGQSPRMAEILACRQAPRGDTDTAHYSNMPPLEETAGFEYAKKVKQQARAAGINVTDNSRYNATIADERCGGDPNAWIHAGDGRSKVRRVIENLGHSCESLGVKDNPDRVAELEAKKEARIKRNNARREEMQQAASGK